MCSRRSSDELKPARSSWLEMCLCLTDGPEHHLLVLSLPKHSVSTSHSLVLISSSISHTQFLLNPSEVILISPLSSPTPLKPKRAPAMMSAKKIEEEVRKIIVNQLDINEEEVTPDASFTDDLGADSLDLVELVMAMEEKFDIDIPDEDAENITTVQKALDYIDNQFRTKG